MKSNKNAKIMIFSFGIILAFLTIFLTIFQIINFIKENSNFNFVQFLSKNSLIYLSLFFLFIIYFLCVYFYKKIKKMAFYGTQNEKKYKYQLDIEKTKSEKAEKTNSELINAINHDARVPLSAIIGYANLATNEIENVEKVKDFLEKIKSSSNHLLSLLNDIFDLTRLENGNLKINEKHENLLESLEQLKNIMLTSFVKKDISFEVDTSLIENEFIFCDCTRLNQILVNILSNMIKYSKSDSSIVLKVVESVCEEDFALYDFVMHSDGLCLDSEMQKMIYNGFTKTEDLMVNEFNRIGFGLSIAKNLIDMMGGIFKLESDALSGTEVKITFEFKKIENITNAKKDEVKTENENLLMNKKILVVDDNDFNREIAVLLLKKEGALVFEAINGLDAVEKVTNSLENDFDLILMDIVMPKMNGIDATKKIRKLEEAKLSSIPIFAMTANDFEEDRVYSFEAGMNEYITKPIDIDVVKEKIRFLFEKSL